MKMLTKCENTFTNKSVTCDNWSFTIYILSCVKVVIFIRDFIVQFFDFLFAHGEFNFFVYLFLILLSFSIVTQTC